MAAETIGEHVGRSMRFRVAFVFVGFVVLFAIIAFRLVQLQVFTNAELDLLARKQYEKEGKTSFYRLPILDRNGEELAVSIPSTSIFARPRLISRKNKTAAALARVLGGSEKVWLEKLKSNRSFVWLRRQVDPEISRKLTELDLEGIFFEPENKRVYPNGSLASHVLGFTDVDGNGLSGIELTLNDKLSRPPSTFLAIKDGKGNPTYIEGDPASKPAREQGGISLTLDRKIQYVLEEELEATQREYDAEAVVGIVMDPLTGEVLALGQRPAFDPNQPGRFDPSAIANRIITHRFEPGSTMKVIFGAEALHQGLLKPQSIINCHQGKIKIGNRTISEAESDHKFGMLSLDKVIRYSSNVGAVKIAQVLGPLRVRAAMDKFGLTQKTEIPLPGEVTSPSRQDELFRPFFLATVGFGQGISVTPIQLVSAFAPFANGGFWVRPQLLAPKDNMAIGQVSSQARRVLSPQSAAAVRDMLVSVTEAKGGTGVAARVPRVRVAGKTGTAQKYVSGEGYGGGRYFSSFVGFLPAENPRLLIGVMVDEPKAQYYASQVAAPLFRKVAERSLHLLGQIPKQTLVSTDNPHDPEVLKPSPESLSSLASDESGRWLMPDMTGMSLREVLRLMGKQLSNITIEGEGYVSEQSPDPGTPLQGKSPILFRMSSRPKTDEARG